LTTIRFVDRDLMMRFRGGGVGHKSTRQATDFFKKDRHTSDVQKRSEPASDIEEEIDEQIEELAVGDEEDDYGYQLGEEQYSEGDKSEDELEDGDFGPEDDGGVVDSDMEEFGYAEL
jgi:hypothetical protein